MKLKIKHFLISIFLIGILTLPYFVFASSAPLQRMQEVANLGSGYDTEVDEFTMSKIIGNVISGFLSLLGLIFVVLIIWAGYNWMTASGNEEKVTKAKSILTRSIIGLIITLSAYAIWKFLFFRLLLSPNL